MSVDNLRELGWMLLHLGEVAPRHTAGWTTLRVPEGIEPVKTGGPREYGGRVVIMSSDQTTLAWALTDSKRVLVSGTLRWPTDYSGGAVDHALDLLRVAEGGFVAGCPREKPPRLSSLGRAKPAVSPLDGDPTELALLQNHLVDAITRGARKRCRAQRRR